MKKLSILFAGILISSVIFTSCNKDVEDSETNSTDNATISGYVYLRYDATTDTLGNPDIASALQYAPAGTRIMLKLDANELYADRVDGNDSIEFPNDIYYASVGANGKYKFTVNVRTGEQVTSKMLNAVEVELNYTENSYTPSGLNTDLHDTTFVQFWVSNDVSVTFGKGDNVFQNLTYTGTPIY